MGYSPIKVNGGYSPNHQFQHFSPVPRQNHDGHSNIMFGSHGKSPTRAPGQQQAMMYSNSPMGKNISQAPVSPTLRRRVESDHVPNSQTNTKIVHLNNSGIYNQGDVTSGPIRKYSGADQPIDKDVGLHTINQKNVGYKAPVIKLGGGDSAAKTKMITQYNYGTSPQRPI